MNEFMTPAQPITRDTNKKRGLQTANPFSPVGLKPTENLTSQVPSTPMSSQATPQQMQQIQSTPMYQNTISAQPSISDEIDRKIQDMDKTTNPQLNIAKGFLPDVMNPFQTPVSQQVSGMSQQEIKAGSDTYRQGEVQKALKTNYLSKDNVKTIMSGLPEDQRSGMLDHLVSKGYELEGLKESQQMEQQPIEQPGLIKAAISSPITFAKSVIGAGEQFSKGVTTTLLGGKTDEEIRDFYNTLEEKPAVKKNLLGRARELKFLSEYGFVPEVQFDGETPTGQINYEKSLKNLNELKGNGAISQEEWKTSLGKLQDMSKLGTKAMSDDQKQLRQDSRQTSEQDLTKHINEIRGTQQTQQREVFGQDRAEGVVDTLAGGGQLFASAVAPGVTAGIQTLGQTDTGAKTLGVVGDTLTKAGTFINKTPGLSNFRDQLSPAKQKEFDIEVGSLLPALLGLKGKKNIIKDPTKFVMDNLTPGSFDTRVTKGLKPVTDAGLKTAGKVVDKVKNIKPIEFAAKKITGTTTAQGKLFKAQNPSLNVLNKNRNMKTLQKQSSEANQLISDAGHKPINTETRRVAHEKTMTSKRAEVEKAIGSKANTKIDQTKFATILDDIIADAEKSGLGKNKADIQALRQESAIMKKQGGIDLATLEKKKQMINGIVNNRGDSSIGDVYKNGMKQVTKAIGEAEDGLLSTIPKEFSNLKKEFGSLKSTYEDVLKADIKSQKAKGMGLVQSYSRIEGVSDILGGIAKTFTKGGEGLSDIVKGGGKLIVGKVLKKANDVDFLIEEGFKGLKPRGKTPFKVKATTTPKPTKLPTKLGLPAPGQTSAPIVAKGTISSKLTDKPKGRATELPPKKRTKKETLKRKEKQDMKNYFEGKDKVDDMVLNEKSKEVLAKSKKMAKQDVDDLFGNKDISKMSEKEMTQYFKENPDKYTEFMKSQVKTTDYDKTYNNLAKRVQKIEAMEQNKGLVAGKKIKSSEFKSKQDIDFLKKKESVIENIKEEFGVDQFEAVDIYDKMVDAKITAPTKGLKAPTKGLKPKGLKPKVETSLKDTSEGKPFTAKVYHGTNAKFKTLDEAFLGKNTGETPTNMAGFSYTDNINVAKTFGKNIIEADITLKKPKVIDANGKNYAQMKFIINDTIENAQKKGYDGLVIKNYEDAGLTSKETVLGNHVIQFKKTTSKS